MTRIADTVDPQTRTIKVRAEMDNSHGRLRPEMFGSIRHVESMRTLPVVPGGAVVQSDGRTSCIVETAPGRSEPVDVQDSANRTGDVLPVMQRPQGGRPRRGRRRHAAARPPEVIH